MKSEAFEGYYQSMVRQFGGATHTYVIMELTKASYEEIMSKMKDAGYDHVFNEHDGRQVIDMHGIAVSEVKDE